MDDDKLAGLSLSATDRELCDTIRQLEQRRAALEPGDPAIYEINAVLYECRQNLVYFGYSKRRMP